MAGGPVGIGGSLISFKNVVRLHSDATNKFQVYMLANGCKAHIIKVL